MIVLFLVIAIILKDYIKKLNNIYKESFILMKYNKTKPVVFIMKYAIEIEYSVKFII